MQCLSRTDSPFYSHHCTYSGSARFDARTRMEMNLITCGICPMLISMIGPVLHRKVTVPSHMVVCTSSSIRRRKKQPVPSRPIWDKLQLYKIEWFIHDQLTLCLFEINSHWLYQTHTSAKEASMTDIDCWSQTSAHHKL